MAALLDASHSPLILAGHGIIRMNASPQLVEFAETLNIPVVTTFMSKGVIPASHKLLLGTAGLNSNDYNFCGFKQADLIICVGYDMVEYHPYLWRRDEHKLVHIHATPAEVDEHYMVDGGVVCHIGASLDALRATLPPPSLPRGQHPPPQPPGRDRGVCGGQGLPGEAPEDHQRHPPCLGP